jgi:hypothetical protein
MRIFFLVAFLLISFAVFGEETQTQETPKKQEEAQKQKTPVLVYPKELLKPLPDMPIPDDSTKEFVEVERESHPAIEINLPTVEELLYVKRPPMSSYEPMRGQDYYQRGGGILTMYGVREPSGQLFNYSVPTGSAEDEDEDED